MFNFLSLGNDEKDGFEISVEEAYKAVTINVILIAYYDILFSWIIIENINYF